jgi:hypothetical protein
LQSITNAGSQVVNQPYTAGKPLLLKAGTFQIVDFGEL